MKKLPPPTISKVRLMKHFKRIRPEEAVYCLEMQNESKQQCYHRFINAVHDAPSVPLVSARLPPLI
jgi:hypothetical protein